MNQIQRPLVLALLAFIAGLLPALRSELSPQVALFTFVTALAFLLFGFPVPGKASRTPASAWIVVVIAGCGATIGSFARKDLAADCRTLLDDNAWVETSGTLAAAHRAGASGTGAPLLPLVGTTVAGLPGCQTEIRVRMPPGQTDLAPGTAIVARGKWRSFPVRSASRWPRDPRYLGFLLIDSIAASPTPAKAVPGSLRIRAAAEARFGRLFPRHLPVVEALVLGRREYMDREMRDRFARAGLSHLLAISGMHVGLLAGALLLLGTALRLSRRRSIFLTLAATWIYLLVIGASPSALRAGTMVSLGLIAHILQRPSASLAIVSAAALVILAVNPIAILDPGFQLSFAGVIGILVLRRPMLGVLPNRLVRRGWTRAPVDAFVVGLAAFVSTAPIVAHHFGIVAPISIVAGLPAVPLMSVALVGAASAALVSPLVPAIASLLAEGSAVALNALDWIAAAAARVPHGNATVGPPPWWTWTVALATGAAAARWFVPGRAKIRRVAGAGSALLVLVVWPILPESGGSNLEVHFIDVGQGDAIAIETPNRRWILIDSGPASATFDAGERQVSPFLRSRGANILDALILTHPDLDHIGGAPAVLRNFTVLHVFEPGLAAGKAPYVDLLQELGEENHWLAARSGRTLEIDGVRLEMLWPDSETVDANGDANQISAIILLRFGEFSMLLTGDAGLEIEEVLVARHREILDVDVLKLGHHGSATSTSRRFLETTRPELAVVSAGRRNRYGHPAPAVVARVEEMGIPIARTDREGTISIVVESGGKVWSRRDW